MCALSKNVYPSTLLLRRTGKKWAKIWVKEGARPSLYLFGGFLAHGIMCGLWGDNFDVSVPLLAFALDMIGQHIVLQDRFVMTFCMFDLGIGPLCLIPFLTFLSKSVDIKK